MFRKFVVNLALRKRFSTSTRSNNKKVGLIGASYSGGQPKRGTELGPSAMRENGLVRLLNENRFEVHDYGDLKLDTVPSKLTHPKVKNLDTFLNAVKQLSERVHRATAENDVALTIGGDHSLGKFNLLNCLVNQFETFELKKVL